VPAPPHTGGGGSGRPQNEKWSDPPTEGVEPRTSKRFGCRGPGALAVDAGSSGEAPPVPRSLARPGNSPPGSPTGIVPRTLAGSDYRTADRTKTAVPGGEGTHRTLPVLFGRRHRWVLVHRQRIGSPTDQPSKAVIVPLRHFCAHSSRRRPVKWEHTRGGNGTRFIRAAPGARPRAGLPRNRCPPP
jgi:hypothetical protein